MKKVLVTRAGGFIGRSLVRDLIRQGVKVYATVYPGHNIYAGENVPNLHVHSLDLNQILNHIADFPKDIEVMYHFAWNGVKPGIRNELDTQIGNVNMSLDCMKLAIAIGIRRIVFPGSMNEYLYCGKPLNKEVLPSPHDAYSAAKIALRYLCSDFASRNDIDFVYTIIASIYTVDRRDNSIIFYTIDKLLHREKPSFTKLEQLWDYVYIDDVAPAPITVGEQGKDGAVYAIGHGDNWPLRNYIRIIHRKINPSSPLGIGEIPYNSGKLPCSCTDLTDIRRDTDFEPRIGFETGIGRVIDYVCGSMEISG